MSAGSDLLELYARYLDAREAGEALELEELCRQNPERAAELRRLDAEWRDVEGLLDRLGGVGSFERRLRGRHGAGIDPGISLEADGTASEAESATKLLEEITARGSGFARYEVRAEIGRGGQGAVLRVWDRDLRRSLALKILLEEGAPRTGRDSPSPETRTLVRFLEEAQITSQLDHPGIVPVHELGLDASGRVYFTMKLVQGQDLRAILALARRGADGWSPTRVLGVLQRVCEAISFAHARGVLHRDLKPANVMVGRFGEVYVMDWGVAHVRGRTPRAEPHARPEDSAVKTLRADDSESPRVTVEGHVVGTPAYMAPEQARGEELDERADVYSIGAMLYHLLVGHMPYCGTEERLAPFQVLRRLLEGPAMSAAELAPEAPAELLAIAARAMAWNKAERYASAAALGDELRAFLEGRVVRAYETGAVAELRKWIARNRPLAAALAAACLVLVAGLVTSLALRAQSERNLELALANEATALAEKGRADHEAEEARSKTGEVLRLSALQRLDELVAEADRMWPAVPERSLAYDDWLRRAKELVAELPEHEEKLAELRARTLPWTEEELARHRANHPKRAELERAKRHLEHDLELDAALEAGEPLRDPAPEDVGVDLASLPTSPNVLNGLAWELIDPDRKDWGQEAKGLVLARRAVELAAGLPPEKRAGIRNSLAWALLAAGRFDEAVAEAELALDEAGAVRVETFQGYLERMEKMVAEHLDAENDGKRAIHEAGIEQEIEKLEAEIAPEWRFADAKDKWWHEQLAKLVAGLKSFSHPATGLVGNGSSGDHGWGVARRAEFARTIVERSTTGAEAARSWSEAIASIASETECPAYGGLRITPQLGLIPIGCDPQSKLWEFGHLATGEPAQRGPDGDLLLGEETGLVFVLLPGGTFLMGAQRDDPGGPNYDPEAETLQGHLVPLREVTLAPFFLSKYEMTQGQWLRFSGHNPSRDNPWAYLAQWNRELKPIDLRHPVETVSWEDCTAVLARLGLVLPSEAQWEYAARAGTTTVWWCGDERDSIADAGNLADRYAKQNGAESWNVEDWDDGNTSHAQVGRYRPNAFGLHDVIGNVWEWCEDMYRAGYRLRTRRGGSFMATASFTRSAFRASDMSSHADGNIGCRPARALRAP